jgi:hypothetical protein
MVRPNARVALSQQRSRRRPLHTVITAVGALATVWPLVVGCDANVGDGGTPAVGRDALQTDIAARLAKAGEQPQSVTCNEDLVGEIGKTTRCEVVISATNSFEPVITVTGVDGGVRLRRTIEVKTVEGLMMNFDLVPVLTKEEVATSLLDESRGNWGDGPTLRSAQAASRGGRETPSTAPSSPVPTPGCSP